MIILGIETSCDETALALIETRDTEYRVIQSLVHSQAELHSAYGGVFPTLAKREHSKNLVPLLEKILKDLPALPSSTSTNKHPDLSGTIELFKKQYGEQNTDLLESFSNAHFLETIPQIDGIAVTQGPGLEPALWVGIIFARMLGQLWNIPVIPVNHMEGHIIGSLLDNDRPSGSWQQLKKLDLPAVALLISGGHTELVKVESEQNVVGINNFSYSIIGQTHDDAVGEAFDKTARLLGLPYPGGPHISMLAHEAREQNILAPIRLPRPMINSDDLNFSFSGLKTAVLYAVQEAEKKDILNEDIKDNSGSAELFKKGLAREFEESIIEVLDKKLRKAIEETSAQSIIIGGGVSANHSLRECFKKISKDYNIPVFLPSFHISGDNALMIALVGAINLNTNKADKLIQKVIHAHGTKKLGE